jgi:transcriptional regulator with XRE-family HTH domain
MEQLGLKVKQQRGGRGIREVAAEIGISAATLSRVETGKQPDLKTFTLICKWLGVDPNTVLGITNASTTTTLSMPQAHFRADKTMSTDTIQELAQLISTVQQAAQSMS